MTELDYFQRMRQRPSAFGFWLFLASLSMLFISGMLLYVLIREHVFGNAVGGTIRLPSGVWASTAILVAGSFTIHKALAAIRTQRQGKFAIYLQITVVLASLFLAVQFPCLWEILAEHREAEQHGLVLYGLVFCLVLLHAAHVIGGIIGLCIVNVAAIQGRYDHEHYLGVKHAAVYWHFLDAVWLTMLTVFLVTG